MVMMHGDDSGLILPPRVAPVQVVLVPIPTKTEEDATRVADVMERLLKELLARGMRAEADWSDKRPGWKFNEWELKGVPVRLEVGPRDLQTNEVTLVRRDNREKVKVSVEGAVDRAAELLVEVQAGLFARASAFRDANTHTAESYDQFKEIMASQRGFIRAYWCGAADCETRIKEETRATVRVIPEDAAAEGPGVCIVDDRPAERRALFAQSY
jgi:prolyl-tRNA synthetase